MISANHCIIGNSARSNGEKKVGKLQSDPARTIQSQHFPISGSVTIVSLSPEIAEVSLLSSNTNPISFQICMSVSTAYLLECLLGWEGDESEDEEFFLEEDDEYYPDTPKRNLKSDFPRAPPIAFSPPPLSDSECSICCFPFDTNKLTLLCSHSFCKDCLSLYCKSKISERPLLHHSRVRIEKEHSNVGTAIVARRENLVGVLCPIIGCGEVIHDLLIRTFLFDTSNSNL